MIWLLQRVTSGAGLKQLTGISVSLTIYFGSEQQRVIGIKLVVSQGRYKRISDGGLALSNAGEQAIRSGHHASGEVVFSVTHSQANMGGGVHSDSLSCEYL